MLVTCLHTTDSSWNYRNSWNYWRHPLNHITLSSEAETHRKCRYERSRLAINTSCRKVTERSCVVGAVRYLALKKHGKYWCFSVDHGFDAWGFSKIIKAFGSKCKHDRTLALTLLGIHKQSMQVLHDLRRRYRNLMTHSTNKLQTLSQVPT